MGLLTNLTYFASTVAQAGSEQDETVHDEFSQGEAKQM